MLVFCATYFHFACVLLATINIRNKKDDESLSLTLRFITLRGREEFSTQWCTALCYSVRCATHSPVIKKLLYTFDT